MNKIIDRHDIPHCLDKSKKVVAICGCFDIFHIGHLDYISGAKRSGDILIVGVNSDKSILINKGRFPLFTIEQRMQLLSSIEYVDFIFSFDEKTFDLSLKLIKPDIFARGIDAAEKGFPEQDTVNEHNIKVIIIGDHKKSSSRDLRKYFE
jgi:rfaE bifunctional protein nucleotidyltransferase chain/domain